MPWEMRERELDAADRPATAPIRLQGIARDFSDGKAIRRILKTLDLEIAAGELTIIAGPSGSGKTTLLTIMGFLLQPSEGRIFIQGREVTQYSPDRLATLRRQGIGFVFQQSALLPALTVLENVVLPFGIQGRPVPRPAKERARELLEKLGLKDYVNARPQQLSLGQQQRVAIVRALINDPPLLLCDEPTSALDAESSAIVLDTLKALSREPTRAVVMVTHDPRVFPFADRLLKIEDGAIIYDSKPGPKGGQVP
jgi:putative ABC transport system ATP-binding protein